MLTEYDDNEYNESDNDEYESFDNILKDSINLSNEVYNYLKSIGDFKILTKDEEIELMKIINDGKDLEEDIAYFLNDPNNLESFNEYINLKEKRKVDILNDEDKNNLLKKYPKLIDYINMDEKSIKAEIAKNNLINSNLKLVVSIAKKYNSKHIPFMDLIQEGNMGLIKAVEKFDITRNCKFSTYAIPWIKQFLFKAISENKLVRVPIHMAITQNKILKIKDDYMKMNGKEISVEELAEVLNISVKNTKYILETMYTTISLDKEVGEDESATLIDVIQDSRKNTPEDHWKVSTLKNEIDNVLNTLNEKEANIIKYRFGLIDGKFWTLEEIGKIYDLTRERIRQLEAVAIRKLKYSASIRNLKSYWKEL